MLVGCAHAPQEVQIPDSYPYGPGSYTLVRELTDVKTIPVGRYPKSVAISPDNKRAYVCNLEGGSIDIIDAETFAPEKRIVFEQTASKTVSGGHEVPSFEEKPVEVCFTGEGRFVWISLLNAGGVVIYDTLEKAAQKEKPFRTVLIKNIHPKATRSLPLRFIPTGRQPKVLKASPDGKWVFAANWRGSSVTVINAKTFFVVKTIKVGYLPRGICFSPSLEKAYVANFGSHTISVIDLKTLRKGRDFQNVGACPRHLALSRDEKYLYVSNHGDGMIREVSLATGKTTRRCHVGTEPRTICLSRNKNFLFVVNYKDNALSVVDLNTMQPFLTRQTLQRPVGACLNPSDDTVWVTGYWDASVRVYSFHSVLASLSSNNLQAQAR